MTPQLHYLFFNYCREFWCYFRVCQFVYQDYYFCHKSIQNRPKTLSLTPHLEQKWLCFSAFLLMLCLEHSSHHLLEIFWLRSWLLAGAIHVCAFVWRPCSTFFDAISLVVASACASADNSSSASHPKVSLTCQDINDVLFKSHTRHTRACVLLLQVFSKFCKCSRLQQSGHLHQLNLHSRLFLWTWVQERRAARLLHPALRHWTLWAGLWWPCREDRRSSIWSSHKCTPCSRCANSLPAKSSRL